jgi:hypothetical protein
MAGVLLHGTSNEVTVAASTAKTVFQLLAAAGHRVKVQGWGAAFKGTSATDPPMLCQVVRQSTAGTMTAGTTNAAGGNIAFKNQLDPETVQTTSNFNATAEPTTQATVESFEVHPQTGYRVFYPMGQEIMIANGGRLGFRVTPGASPATVSCVIEVDMEE